MATTASELFRVYADWEPVDEDGYPFAWQEVKVLVREAAGNRCERCGHPYAKGDGEWSLCDQACTHGQPIRIAVFSESAAEVERAVLDERAHKIERAVHPEGAVEVERAASRKSTADDERASFQESTVAPERIEAQWRILTTHHLSGQKRDLRWSNLVALCQVCHLSIQGRVKMDQVYPFEHSGWFKPYAAAFYARTYLGEELTREQVDCRLEELLALERML